MTLFFEVIAGDTLKLNFIGFLDPGSRSAPGGMTNYDTASKPGMTYSLIAAQSLSWE